MDKKQISEEMLIHEAKMRALADHQKAAIKNAANALSKAGVRSAPLANEAAKLANAARDRIIEHAGGGKEGISERAPTPTEPGNTFCIDRSDSDPNDPWGWHSEAAGSTTPDRSSPTPAPGKPDHGFGR